MDKEGKISDDSDEWWKFSAGEFEGENKLHLWLHSGIATSKLISDEDISGQKINGIPSVDLSPVTTTNSASGITKKSVLLTGTVTANCLFTNVYVEYGTTTDYGKSVRVVQSPLHNICTSEVVSLYVSGLTPGTLYHFRVKAVNFHGTSFGGDKTFTTYLFSDPVTDIDGNVYNTVPVGNQVWMAENLKTTLFKDGTVIPIVTDNKAWGNLTTHGYCWYNNNEAANKATYGTLYNWYTVGTGKLCPAGWQGFCRKFNS